MEQGGACRQSSAQKTWDLTEAIGICFVLPTRLPLELGEGSADIYTYMPATSKISQFHRILKKNRILLLEWNSIRMSTFAGLWVLLRWHGVFTLLVPEHEQFCSAKHSCFIYIWWFFCAHFREKTWTSPIPQWFLDAPCSRHVPWGMGAVAF